MNRIESNHIFRFFRQYQRDKNRKCACSSNVGVMLWPVANKQILCVFLWFRSLAGAHEQIIVFGFFVQKFKWPRIRLGSKSIRINNECDAGKHSKFCIWKVELVSMRHDGQCLLRAWLCASAQEHAINQSNAINIKYTHWLRFMIGQT